MHRIFKDLKQKHSFKITIIGDIGTGKTSILNRYVKDSFSNVVIPTIIDEYYTKTLKTKENVTIKAQIWDTSGEEKYDSISNHHFINSKGLILVYDITNKNSFDKLNNLMTKIKNKCDKDCIVMIVGNKLDIVQEDSNKREITEEMGMKFANQYNINFIEVSAKNDTRIVDLFEELLSSIYNNYTSFPPIYTENSNKRSEFMLIEGDKNDGSGYYCFCFF
jgi:small GTP-binding protein